MGRMSTQRWKLDRDLGEPEDEFFGLIEDEPFGDDPQDPGSPAGYGPGDLLNAAKRLFGGLVERRHQQEELEELEELRQAVAPSTPVSASDLDEHMVRLGNGRDWEEFLSAESEVSLFDEIQATQQRRYRTAAWGLWLAGLLFAYLGYKSGQGYLKHLTGKDLPVEAWITQYLKGDQAHGAMVVCGILAPLGAFLLCATSLGQLLGGALERSVARVVLGLAGLLAVVLVFGMITGGHYPSAVITCLVFLGAVPLVERLMVRLGVY